MSADRQYAAGDRVCHARAFLRAIGWFVNVPEWGTVRIVDDVPGRPAVLYVEWHGASAPPRILASNVIRYDRRHIEPA